jgi:glycosyltransferase involved in cell wall biosynthesis
MERECGHRKASLVMHTDPLDQEGPNLFAVSEYLGIKDSVFFSNQRLEFEKMAVVYGMADCCINISYAEGFGLGTLEAMQCGTPIIALKTGGLTRQVVNHIDGSENGVAIPVSVQSLVGSQSVPYIYEDYCTTQDLADALWKMSQLTPTQMSDLRKKVYNYARTEFSLKKTVDDWHETMLDTVKNWKERRASWTFEVIK